MFYLENGDIVPGSAIGILKLGMSCNQIQDIIKEFEIEELEDYWRFIAGDVTVWVDKKEDQAKQIMVFGNFLGKYAGKIGVGSTLTDVKNQLGIGWHEELEAFEFNNIFWSVFRFS